MMMFITLPYYAFYAAALREISPSLFAAIILCLLFARCRRYAFEVSTPLQHYNTADMRLMLRYLPTTISPCKIRRLMPLVAYFAKSSEDAMPQRARRYRLRHCFHTR